MPGEWMTYYVHNSTFTDNDTVIAGPLADQVRLEDGNYVQQSAWSKKRTSALCGCPFFHPLCPCCAIFSLPLVPRPAV